MAAGSQRMDLRQYSVGEEMRADEVHPAMTQHHASDCGSTRSPGPDVQQMVNENAERFAERTRGSPLLMGPEGI